MAGCGGTSAPRSTAPEPVPADQRLRTSGERIAVRGDVAPEEYGPLDLRGRYRVSFAQRGEGVDFAAEVPFTARLEQRPRGGGAPKVLELFEQAARTGATTVTARGRWMLVVDFGDSPFAVTLTPDP